MYCATKEKLGPNELLFNTFTGKAYKSVYTLNDYSIKQFHGGGKMYSLIYRHGKIVISKQIQKTITYYAIQVKLGPN